MLKAPEHQVAGHFAGDGQLGPLVDGRGLFFKPLQSTDRGSTELSFYSSFSGDPRVPSSLRRRFFPAFHGTRLVGDGGCRHPHLAIEDLTAGLDKPWIVDLKIGSRTWAPHHPEPYFDKCIKKDRETTTLALGFRISGFQFCVPGGLWKPSRGEVRRYAVGDVRGVLRLFGSAGVYGGPGGVLEQLKELKGWFEEQTLYHFYSASVMLIYEKGKGGPRVKMVDFAHVVDGEGVIDHNFLGGLCSLIKFVSEVVEEEEKAKLDKNGDEQEGEKAKLDKNGDEQEGEKAKLDGNGDEQEGVKVVLVNGELESST